MGRQQSMHLLSPKMIRQLIVVDFIQQYLPTRRWHHQSILLFWAFKDQLKSVFGHNMKLSMIPTCSPSQFPHFNIWRIPHGLKNTCKKRWFHNQRWNKGIRHDLQQQQHENQHPNNILNGDQALPSIELSTGKVDTNKLESPNWHLKTARVLP